MRIDMEDEMLFVFQIGQDCCSCSRFTCIIFECIMYTSFSLSNTLWFAGVPKILHTVRVQMTPSCLGGTWVSMELGTFIIVRYCPLGQHRCISTYRTTCSSYEPNSGGTSEPNAPPETWTLQCYARNMFQLF